VKFAGRGTPDPAPLPHQSAVGPAIAGRRLPPGRPRALSFCSREHTPADGSVMNETAVRHPEPPRVPCRTAVRPA